MSRETERDNRIKILLFCLLTSFLIMMFCTKCSFLYPFQDWEDDNIIGTVGRGMMRGMVPFRDLYDQKGPAAYFVFGAAQLLSPGSFLGLFAVEVVCFALFLYFSWKTVFLFERRHAVLAIPLIGALVASAMSMAHGGSLEELSLPALAYALYSAFRYYGERFPERMETRTLLANGFLAGCIFWAKYTMLGLHFGWMASMFFALIAKKRTGEAFASAGIFLLGMFAATVPWVAYYAANGALGDLIEYYFVYNITGYGSAGRGAAEVLLTIGRNTLATFYRNAQYSVLTVLGVAYLTFFDPERRLGREAKAALWAMCVLSCVGIYLGETGYRYYGLVLAAFAPLGAVPLLWSVRSKGRTPEPFFLVAGTLAFSVLFGAVTTDNAYLRGTKRDEMPQFRFASVMEREKKEEKVTLLCYDMMDAGFYLASGYEPEFRSFTRHNNTAPQVKLEQDELLRSRFAEFVVTRSKAPDIPGYERIDEATYRYEDGSTPTFYLYRRTD